MFPKNKINILIRLLCLISYIIVIFSVNSLTTLIALHVAYCLLSLFEINFRSFAFIIVTLVFLWICSIYGNYLLFRIMLLIEYCFYFLDTTYYVEEKEVVKINQKDYVRFKNMNKKKKKGLNNTIAVYIVLH